MTARLLDALEAATLRINTLATSTGPAVLGPADAKALIDAQHALSEARALLLDAQNTVHAARTKARAEGFKQGLADTADALIMARHERRTLIEDTEADMVHMALELTRRIVGRRLEEDPQVMADMVARAVSIAHGKDRVRVHVNPEDLQLLSSIKNRMEAAAGGPVTLVEDPRVPLRGSHIHTESGVIEADLHTQIEVLAEAMGIALKEPDHG